MDYRIEAFNVLLKEDCILQSCYPLIPFREELINKLKKSGIHTKKECMELSREQLLKMGLPDEKTADVFRRFLTMYDAKESKMKEIAKAAATEEEAVAFRQLYLLPGVKAMRARLYFDAGYKTLESIAAAVPEQILTDTAEVIGRKGLELKIPLPKEVRTHIAVAKAFTEYAVNE